MLLSVCVSVCVCVREREGERERESLPVFEVGYEGSELPLHNKSPLFIFLKRKQTVICFGRESCKVKGRVHIET